MLPDTRKGILIIDDGSLFPLSLWLSDCVSKSEQIFRQGRLKLGGEEHLGCA